MEIMKVGLLRETIIMAHNRNKTTDCEEIDHRSYAQLKQLRN